MFAGSCAVGCSVLGDYRVVANDVELYSYSVARAVIQDCQRTLTVDEATNLLWDRYSGAFTELAEPFSGFLESEEYFLRRPHAFRKYGDFCARTPHIEQLPKDALSPDLLPIFERAQTEESVLPYCLFSTYFMNSYFGVRQCIQIDAIRCAIDRVAGPFRDPQDDVLFHKLIAALIYAASECVSSPGHFAQYNAPNNRNINMYVVRQRSKDMWECFLGCVEELFGTDKSNGEENHALQEDAGSLLDPSSSWYGLITRDSLIYADPPYTEDQYSRFYHVLNTLILYDYPDCRGKGRYRSDRYVSHFSLKSTAATRLDALLRKVGAAGVPLILSYLDEGLVDLSALAGLCRSHFAAVDSVEIDYNHSNQGRSPDTCTTRKPRRKEMLYVCLP